MNYYFLPGTGIFGGIKVGFQFCELLSSLGCRIVAATPQGQAPQWFACSVPVVDRDGMLANLSTNDRVIFSLPHDYKELRKTPAKLIFHCQGTDPLIDPILSDPAVLLLSCWDQAGRYMFERESRTPINVGISISEEFFYSGEVKQASYVSYMPRRGSALIDNLRHEFPDVSLLPIDGMSEARVAHQLKRSSIFVATSVGEWFGLPALEAMASGCVVVSPQTVGGGEYLFDGENCFLYDGPHSLKDTLMRTLRELLEAGISRYRYAAISTAYAYHPDQQRSRVATALNNGLGELLS